MIRKVKLENWRSHWETEMKFSKGTNAIIGLMGTGKSSVLSAISFALFGTFPALKSREVKLDELIMRKPQKKEEAKISVEFDIGENNYEIERKIERGKGTTSSEIRKNGELLDSGTSRTTELVEKYLKIDYELFSRAIYSEQNGLHYFLEIPKGQRMERIDRLLKIDRFEKARSNTTTLINRLKDRSEDKKNMIEDMKEREEFNKIDELKKEIKKLKEETEKFEEQIENIGQREEKLKDELEKVKEKKGEIEKVKERKNKAKGNISTLKEDIEKIEKKFENVEIDLIEERAEKKREERGEIEEMIEDAKNSKERVHEKIQKNRANIRNLQDRIEKLKDVEGKCPICDNKLGEVDKRELLEKRYDKMESHEEKINEHKEKEEKLGERIEKLKEDKEDLEEQLKKLEDLKEEKEEMKEKKERLNAFEKRLNNQRDKLKEMKEKYSNEKLDELQEKLRKFSSKKSEYKSKIKSNKEFLNDKKERLEKIREKKEMFEKYKEDVKRMDFLIEDTKKFRNALEKTQLNLRKRFIETVNKTMDDIWEDLYPYDDYTGIRLNAQEGDYLLELRENNSWLNVEGVVSGGERTAACLTLRIAFALVLAPNLKWLVLDEPTHNLDERAVSDLAEVLRDKVNQFVDQVFLITHDKKLEDAVTGYLYILEREKEEDEPTQVNQAQTPMS